MKALTLTQPYATLVAIGAKTIETRSWSTKYRGRVAIHAGRKAGSIQFVFQAEPFRSALQLTDNSTLALPLGAVVAIADLVDVVPTVSVADELNAQELAFGDYSAGRFAWILRDVERLARPMPCRGALGLWEWRNGE